MQKHRAPAVVLFLVYFVFTLTLLYASGAFQSGFDHYPDEPAHFVTGLMVREFIAERFPAAPLSFAKDFYLHYPMVAFGHWPPLFYFLEAAWMLLLPPNHTSLLFLLAALTAGTALLVYGTAAQKLPPALAVLAGMTFIVLPLTQTYSSEVMLEIPLTLFSLIAVLAMIRCLDRPTWSAAAWFGLAASLAILTKSSAWLLGPALLLTPLFTRRWKTLVHPQFLLSGGIVLVLCVPFYVWSRKMAAAGLEGRSITLGRIAGALAHLTAYLPALLGVVLLLLAACGFVVKVILPLRTATVENYWAVMAVYIVAVILFHAVAPTVAEARKVFMALPALLLLSFAGLHWVGGKSHWRAPAVAVVVLGFFTARTFYAAPHGCDAFKAPAQALMSHPEYDRVVTLISSNRPGGEGAFIAEIAQHEPHPVRVLLRATKLLASSTWNGLNYKPRYDTAEGVMTALESMPVRVVVVDTLPGSGSAHHELLLRMLRQYAQDWEPIYSDTSACGEREHIEIHRLKKNVTGPPGKIRIDLTDKLNTILEYQVLPGR